MKILVLLSFLFLISISAQASEKVTLWGAIETVYCGGDGAESDFCEMMTSACTSWDVELTGDGDLKGQTTIEWGTAGVEAQAVITVQRLFNGYYNIGIVTMDNVNPQPTNDLYYELDTSLEMDSLNLQGTVLRDDEEITYTLNIGTSKWCDDRRL